MENVLDQLGRFVGNGDVVSLYPGVSWGGSDRVYDVWMLCVLAVSLWRDQVESIKIGPCIAVENADVHCFGLTVNRIGHYRRQLVEISCTYETNTPEGCVVLF